MSTKAKILMYDIETTPLKAYIWQLGKQVVRSGQLVVGNDSWGIISISYRWMHEKKTHTIDWGYEEQSTYKVLSDFIPIAESADVIIGKNNCLAPWHRVLKKDFTWCKLEDIKIGDELLAFEEYPTGGKNRARKLIPATVTNNFLIKKECVEVLLSNGDVITAAVDHPWLSMGINYDEARWRTSKELQIGMRLCKYLTPWELDTSYEAGWLAGFLAGEGNLNVSSIGFCQVKGDTFQQALDYVDNLGFSRTKTYCRRNSEKNIKHKDVYYSQIVGGKWKTIEVLGKIQCKRLIANGYNRKNGWGALQRSNDPITITSIKNIGICLVSALETSTGTYIAEGYAMHNCSFDDKMIAGLAMLHGVDCPPHIFADSDDLQKQFKKHFRLPSQGLDYISYKLGLGGKVKMEMQDWVDIMEKNNNGEKSFKKMLKYGAKDVDDTVKIWNYCSKYFTPKFKLNNWNMDRTGCPQCSGHNLTKQRVKQRASGAMVQVWQCKDCGRYSQSSLNKEDKK